MRSAFAAKRAWRRLGFAAWCVFLAAILSEIVLQIAPRAFPVHVQKLLAPRTRLRLELVNLRREYACEDVRFCKPQPHATIHDLRQDENGFPNRPGRYTDEDRFSIVAIGDSFTHGNTHRESYPRALERHTGRSVLNLGLVGASPQMAYEALVRYGLRKRPDIVVLGVFHGNDFQDMMLYAKRLQLGEPYLRPEAADAPTPSLFETPASWVLHNSNFVSVSYKLGSILIDAFTVGAYGQLGNRLDWLKRAHGVEGDAEPRVRYFDVMIGGRKYGAMKHPLPVELPFDDDSRLFVDLGEIIEAIETVTASVEAELLVVLFPTGAALYSEFVSGEEAEDAVIQRVLWEYEQVTRNLRRLCSSLDVAFLDLRDGLVNELANASPTPQIFDGKFGGHFNPTGNDWIGRLVAEHLSAIGMLEGRGAPEPPASQAESDTLGEEDFRADRRGARP